MLRWEHFWDRFVDHFAPKYNLKATVLAVHSKDINPDAHQVAYRVVPLRITSTGSLSKMAL